MTQQWADYRVFWREFRRTFQTTGAVLPSGPALSAALAHYVRNGDGRPGGRRILEVGPGTGAVTQHIVRALRNSDRLDLVERNEEFVARLRERLKNDSYYRRYASQIELRHISIEDVSEDQPYDVIVSGLPLNNFAAPLVEQILAKLMRLMAPVGTLSFFEYIAVRRAKAVLSGSAERQRLREIGELLDDFLASEVRRDRVLANIPPAWVHHVRREPVAAVASPSS